MKDIKTLKNMIHQMSVILDRKQKRKMLGISIVIMLCAVFELLGVTAMLPFMESILKPQDLYEKWYVVAMVRLLHIDSDGKLVMCMGIAIIMVYLIKNLFLLWSNYLQCQYSCHTQKELSVVMMRAYLNRSYSYFLDHNSAEILRGIDQDVYGVYKVIVHFLKFLSEGLAAVLIAVGLFVMDVSMALGVSVAGAISLLIIVFVLKRKVHRLGIIAREANGVRNRWIYESINGVKDVFVYNKKKYFLSKFSDAYEKGAAASAEFNFVSASPERIIEAVCVAGIIGIVLFRINMGVESSTFVSKIAVFAMGAFRLMPSFARIAGNINEFIYSRPAVEGTYENITAAREYLKGIDGVKEEDTETSISRFESEIDVESISWKYDRSPSNVLEGLSLKIRKGEAIGIIGESGSGKSTLSDILLHLYRPQAGVITMDGVDINKIPESWNRCIGYVPQMVFLRDSSVRDNVAFGEDDIDDARVWDALDKADLKTFVEGLPDGLDTVVGERGIKFSGGQRQRIAIARALYYEPEILILDEATSALDNDTEKAVMDAIDSLHGNITLMIIAHRLTTIKNCDRVYEIRDGKAIERSVEDVI